MSELRKGMWVEVDDKIGILVRIGPAPVVVVRPNPDEPEKVSFALQDGEGEVHFVDAKGITYYIMPQPLCSLRQARFESIPKSRRPSKKIAASLGYV